MTDAGIDIEILPTLVWKKPPETRFEEMQRDEIERYLWQYMQAQARKLKELIHNSSRDMTADETVQMLNDSLDDERYKERP